MEERHEEDGSEENTDPVEEPLDELGGEAVLLLVSI